VQRFGDLDGVYAPGPDGPLRFHALPPPEDAAIERVVGLLARRIARLLEQRGLGAEADPAEADPLAEEQPLAREACDSSSSTTLVIVPPGGRSRPG
jgi:hypothetical protein